MARPIMRRKEAPFDLTPANPVTRRDPRLELVFFETVNGEVVIYNEDPGERPELVGSKPRKRKAKAKTVPVTELDDLTAGLDSGENSK